MLLGAIALLLLAFFLVAGELVVPSHGILTIIAALVAIASVVMAYQVTPGLGVIFTLLLVVATPAVFYGAIKIYPNTAVGKRVLLKSPSGAAVEAFTDEQARLGQFLGRQGIALTLLRPAGSVEIDGTRIDAMSESDMIEAGTRVEVVQVSGLKVVVKSVG